MAPDADQEEERHERELEAGVEQDHVAGRKHAQHRRLEHQQKHIEADRPVFDGVPTDEYGGH